MNLNSRKSLIARICRGTEARRQFVDSHLAKALAHQIRATRDKLNWSQEKLAVESGMNQNAISRLESPDYGKPTLTTLKRIAAAMDVGLVVRFVPFSELIDWVSGTPRTIEGLTTSALAVSCFDDEEGGGVFGEQERSDRTVTRTLPTSRQNQRASVGSDPRTVMPRGYPAADPANTVESQQRIELKQPLYSGTSTIHVGMNPGSITNRQYV